MQFATPESLAMSVSILTMIAIGIAGALALSDRKQRKPADIEGPRVIAQPGHCDPVRASVLFAVSAATCAKVFATALSVRRRNRFSRTGTLIIKLRADGDNRLQGMFANRIQLTTSPSGRLLLTVVVPYQREDGELLVSLLASFRVATMMINGELKSRRYADGTFRYRWAGQTYSADDAGDEPWMAIAWPMSLRNAFDYAREIMEAVTNDR